LSWVGLEDWSKEQQDNPPFKFRELREAALTEVWDGIEGDVDIVYIADD
jgi:hypothetical protein